MKNLKYFMGLMIVTLCVTGQAKEGTEGHGGGGIQRNGAYLTFGQSQLQLGQPLVEVPGLDRLRKVYGQLKINDDLRSKLIMISENIGNRQYFSVKQKLNKKQRREFIRAYRSALDIPVSDDSVVVYAVTKGSETYLMPEFFALDEAGQTTILFHESVWVGAPKASYKSIFDLELLFEKIQREAIQVYNADFVLKLYATFGISPAEAFSIAAQSDLETQCLPEKIMSAEKGINILELLGKEAVAYATPSSCGGTNPWISREPIFRHVVSMHAKYPCSQLYKTLYLFFQDSIAQSAFKYFKILVEPGPDTYDDRFGIFQDCQFGGLERNFKKANSYYIRFSNGVSGSRWGEPFFQVLAERDVIAGAPASGAAIVNGRLVYTVPSTERVVGKEWRPVGRMFLPE